MAIIDQNIVTMGLRGRVGNLIFRSWGDKSVVSAAPSNHNRKWSQAQTENRKRFRDAMIYARMALKDPVKQKYYRSKVKGMQTPWNAAVADYMKKPVIHETDISHYQGNKKDVIKVKAKDNFRITAVIVTILTAQGITVETGMATRSSGNTEWVYQTRSTNQQFEGSHVLVQVSDMPGNTTQMVKVVSRK